MWGLTKYYTMITQPKLKSYLNFYYHGNYFSLCHWSVLLHKTSFKVLLRVFQNFLSYYHGGSQIIVNNN